MCTSIADWSRSVKSGSDKLCHGGSFAVIVLFDCANLILVFSRVDAGLCVSEERRNAVLR